LKGEALKQGPLVYIFASKKEEEKGTKIILH
jgi:hypothetical protein